MKNEQETKQMLTTIIDIQIDKQYTFDKQKSVILLNNQNQSIETNKIQFMINLLKYL
jgi:hypothetical protein